MLPLLPAGRLEAPEQDAGHPRGKACPQHLRWRVRRQAAESSKGGQRGSRLQTSLARIAAPAHLVSASTGDCGELAASEACKDVACPVC